MKLAFILLLVPMGLSAQLLGNKIPQYDSSIDVAISRLETALNTIKAANQGVHILHYNGEGDTVLIRHISLALEGVQDDLKYVKGLLRNHQTCLNLTHNEKDIRVPWTWTDPW